MMKAKKFKGTLSSSLMTIIVLLLTLFAADSVIARQFSADSTGHIIYYNTTSPTGIEIVKGEPAYAGEITLASTVIYNGKTYKVTTK
jgi:hypothetical protein